MKALAAFGIALGVLAGAIADELPGPVVAPELQAPAPLAPLEPSGVQRPEEVVLPGLPASEQPEGPAATLEPESPPVIERDLAEGIASWYGPGLHGRRTASGERFDQHALTAAHRSLPFGTIVRVRSLVNGKTVDVRINDRGPFIKRRIIDLSRGAAEALGLLQSRQGVKAVVLSILEPRR